MDDLIKRSDAINLCEKWRNRTNEHHDKNGWYIADTLLNTIKELPSADRPQEWIPCSERMPEYRKTVLISTFWGVKTGFLDSTEAYGDFWEIIEEDATTGLHNIYAWMPLPKPWKGTDDE